MVQHVDWINLMSYDLHGFWDQNNAIGSIVQGHTNLTEIKSSVELLWRVGIPPSKVVLGTGFYGRSFQLADPSCNTPGCAFSGAANPGSCTNTAGILGYFGQFTLRHDALCLIINPLTLRIEIMDLLNGTTTTSSKKRSQTITPIHDERDAVNYFTYDDDQWVSFDNNVTFKQKVAWANETGYATASETYLRVFPTSSPTNYQQSRRSYDLVIGHG
jgi:chitinase